jgi:acyl dehydratase
LSSSEGGDRIAKVVIPVSEISGFVGRPLGHSDWITMTQGLVDGFADVTGDHQWIHVDPDRAAQSRFGGTIAQGFLTLSLMPTLVAQVYVIDGVSMRVNYGLNSVRFPCAVSVGSRIRASVTLTRVERVSAGTRVESRIVCEIEGEQRPGCVMDAVSLLVTTD